MNIDEALVLVRKKVFEIAPFSVWVPIVAGLVLIATRKTSVPLVVLMVHLFCALIVEAVSRYLSKHAINNLFLLHIYTVEEGAMITFFYSYLLKPLLSRRFFIWIIILFFCLAALNAAFLQPLTVHNTYARSLEGLMIMTWAVLYFYLLLREDTPDRSGTLIINSALLLYFAASVLLFSLSNFLDVGKKEVRLNIWAMHALASIIMYILIAIGLWKQRKTGI